MPAVTRKGDNCTSHDQCAAVPLVSGSSNVFINGQAAGRKGDTYQTHGCEDHPSHSDSITGGSSSVFVNGTPIARVGDSVSYGNTVSGGSSNVFAG